MNAPENDRIDGRTTGMATGCAFCGLETPEVVTLHREAADRSGTVGMMEARQGDFRGTSANRETAGGLKVPEAADAQSDTASGGQRIARCAGDEAERAWRAVYEPVERAIVEEHERRVANRVRRQKEKAEEQRRTKGDLLEATEGFSAVWEREMWTYEKIVAWANGSPAMLSCLAEAVRREATRLIDRLRHAERRPMYYEAENARRRALAEERRRIRKRTTTNPCPTREQILDGWLHRSDSHEATIRFGSLLMDLECHLDNSLVFDDDGAIVGRRGGVKRWLQENIPALYLRYTTVMRFKAAAQKLRQIAELRDPMPAALIVAQAVESDKADCVRPRCGRNCIDPAANTDKRMEDVGVEDVRLRCGRKCGGMSRDAVSREIATENAHAQSGVWENADDARLRCGRSGADHAANADKRVEDVGVANMGMEDVGLRCGRNGADHAEVANEEVAETRLRCGRDSVAHARAIWREVVAGIGCSPTALMARIDALTDPQRMAGCSLNGKESMSQRLRRGRIRRTANEWDGYDRPIQGEGREPHEMERRCTST